VRSLLLILVLYTSAAVALDSDHNAILYSKIEDLETRLREMNGRVQQLEYAHKQLVAKIGNVVDDINYRFAKLESKPEGTKTNDSIKSIKEYDQMVSEGRFSDALHGLKNYVQYADDGVKGEVYYLLGRCYLAENNYKEAGANFLKSYKYYPTNPKAASSLIYLAISLSKLDKSNRACSMLERAHTEYPNMSQEEKELYQSEVLKLRCSSAKLPN